MRRRLLFLALGIGALLFVGVLAWHFFYSPPALTKTLTDGSTVTFLKITTGTNHTHLTGTILQRTAARFLSDAWLRKLKITRARGQLNFRAFAMSNSNHVFWVNLSGPSFIQPMPGGNFIYNVTVGDDAGGEMKNQSLSTYRTPDGQLCAFAISILPTGSPRLRVRVQRRLFTTGRDVYANTSERAHDQ